MGMFDTVKLLEPNPLLVCPNGHPLLEFQTKDLQRYLLVYWLVGDKLYSEANRITTHPVLYNDNVLITTTRTSLEPVQGPVTIKIYDSCNQCPVTEISTRNREYTNKLFPWQEFALTILDGKITAIHSIKNQTAEDVKQEYKDRVVDDE